MTLAASWPGSSTVEAVAVLCRARSVPGAALSITERPHSDEPQSVARVRHLIRTYRAFLGPSSTDCVYALVPPSKGSGTAYS